MTMLGLIQILAGQHDHYNIFCPVHYIQKIIIASFKQDYWAKSQKPRVLFKSFVNFWTFRTETGDKENENSNFIWQITNLTLQ